MKNLDVVSKRIFIAAISISLVLLSLSAFLLTIQRVTAAPEQATVVSRPTVVGLGIIGNKGYYMEFNGNEYQVRHKILN